MAKRSQHPKNQPREVPTKAPSRLTRDWLAALALLLAVVLAYTPVWWAGYSWDDDLVLTANPVIVGPLGLKEIWTTGAADICPLTLTTFWVEHALWGLAPLPYHLVNVLFHAASAVVLWRVLRSLRIPGAWLGAALWALHPLQVESAAWIAEMKNTQSCLFYLLSILFFVRLLKSTQENSRLNYVLTLLFAALAMASKSSTIILPIVLCLCAWWVEQRWNWRNLAKVLPVFLMAVAAGIVSIWTQRLWLATDADPLGARSWPERLATAGDAVWFYLGKLIWPDPLIAVYPRWQIDAAAWTSWLPLLAALIFLFLLWLKRNSWARPWFFAFAYFLVALLPALGLVNNTFYRLSFVADHFQYLASIGPLALVGAGMAWLATRIVPRKQWQRALLGAGNLLSFAILVTLPVMTWQRAMVYQDQETLWTDTLGKNPGCWLAHNNLGNALVNSSRLDEGIAHLEEAVKLNPDFGDAHCSLGGALFQKGEIDQAITHFQKALEINPNFAVAHYDLGVALKRQGQWAEATTHFQKAVELNPDFTEAHNCLGIAYAREGRLQEALAQFQEVLRVKPDYPDAQGNLAKVQAALDSTPHLHGE